MRICLTGKGPRLEDQFDERFGRSPYLLLIDQSEITAVKNPGILVEHGAGIAAARAVVDQGVDALITGRLGPNAEEVLSAAAVAVYHGVPGTLAAVLTAFHAGQLRQLLAPSAEPEQ